MPKRLETERTVVETNAINNVETYHGERAARVGIYYSKFNTHQRKRFHFIAASIANKLGINMKNSPAETVLVRMVAVNTIRVEQALAEVVAEEKIDYESAREAWILKFQKEIRDGIQLLHSITKVSAKKKGVSAFDDLRNEMREQEDLPPSKEGTVQPDGHDRRYHDDGVNRSKS